MTPEVPIDTTLDDARLIEIAHQYGTPLIVYSEDVLRRSALELIDALPDGAELVYSIKANPSPYIMRVFRDLGLLAETASIGEFSHAIIHDFPSSKMLLGGPAMSHSALQAAREHEPLAIQLESENAIIRTNELGVGNVPILLRVNPIGLESNVQTRMTGIASHFGIDESRLPVAIELIQRLGLKYAGLSMYVGTQAEGARAIAANTLHLLLLSDRMEKVGFPRARILNFGGGFPVPECPEQPQLDLSALRSEFNEIVQLRNRTSDERFMFESGRYLVNDAGILLTQVVDVKISLGKRFAILDTGINSLGLRQLKYRTYAPDLRVLDAKGAVQETSLYGPTCTPIDTIAENVLLPPIQPGSIICIPRFGAYSVCFSPTTLCGQGYPAEVAVSCDGSVHLIRKHPAHPVGFY